MQDLCFSSQEEIRHAYILSSPSREFAFAQALRIAQAAVCRGHAPYPCGQCTPCIKVSSMVHPDVRVISRLTDDKGKPKQAVTVDQVREIVADAVVLPNEAPRKVYIFQEADLMNIEAQNAALKLLEEPPNGAVLLLCAINSGRLLTTVRSRCTELSFAGTAEDETAEISALSEAYLKAAASGNAFALWQFCEDNNALSFQEMTAFCTETALRLTDMLCSRRDAMGMSPSRLLSLEKLMEKCIRALKVNVNVKQVFGLIAVSSDPLSEIKRKNTRKASPHFD